MNSVNDNCTLLGFFVVVVFSGGGGDCFVFVLRTILLSFPSMHTRKSSETSVYIRTVPAVVMG